MYDNDSKGISYSAGFFMLIAFTIAGLILASIISIPVWKQMTGLGFEDMQKGLTDPTNADAMKVLQSISAVVGFLLPTIVTAFFLNRRPLKLLGFSGEVKPNQAALVVGLMFTALFVSGGLSYINEIIPISSNLKAYFDKLENDYNDQVKAIIGLKSNTDFIIALFVMAFLPALCEEVLFRGGLQNFLTRSTQKPWLSIVIVSILFSVVHFSYYGFLSRMFLGIVLGAIFHYSGKIWLSILGHFINNAVALTILFFYIKSGKSIDEAMNEDVKTYWGLLFLPLVIMLIIYFKKASVRTKTEEKNYGA